MSFQRERTYFCRNNATKSRKSFVSNLIFIDRQELIFHKDVLLELKFVELFVLKHKLNLQVDKKIHRPALFSVTLPVILMALQENK